MANKPRMAWKKCKGCGRGICFFLEDYPPHYVAGSVGHEKPMALVGVPNSVSCALYNSQSAEVLTELHRDAEAIEEPTDFVPALN